jgi:hypothetical protein
MREIRTSGSVRGEGGNPLAYSTRGEAGWDEGPGTGDEGQLRQTKPNLGRMGHLGDGEPARGQ